jgi:transposase-like protein
MPALAPEKRAAILADIRSGRKSRNAIAREHGVSAGTVTNIARQAGLTAAFDRSATKSATEAAVADLRAIRVTTSRRFLVETNLLLDQMHQPHTAFNFGGKDNTYEEHEFPEPPVDAKRTLITSAAIAYDKHLAQERHDADDGSGLSAVDAWLRGMLGETK